MAGRIRSLRNSGMFIDLLIHRASLQLFCHKDTLRAEDQALLKLLDLGDIVGAKGLIRRTPRGELTVNVTELTLLSKALPEKYHGLSDVEIRYRQRYLDLIMNEDSRTTSSDRSRIISHIRSYLGQEATWRWKHPCCRPWPALPRGPFMTHHNALDMPFTCVLRRSFS